MLIKNRNEVYSLIYKFARDPNICLIGITKECDILRLITDARDQSSYHYVDITFPPYNADQLRNILQYRSKQAFYPQALDQAVIPICTALAAQRNGYARYVTAYKCKDLTTTLLLSRPILRENHFHVKRDVP